MSVLSKAIIWKPHGLWRNGGGRERGCENGWKGRFGLQQMSIDQTIAPRIIWGAEAQAMYSSPHLDNCFPKN